MAVHPHLIPPAARTTDGQSDPLLLHHDTQRLDVLVDATAASGTSPQLTVSAQWSTDGQTWADGDPPDAFTPLTEPAALARSFTVKAPWVRLAWTVTGTSPSFTFSADAHWPGTWQRLPTGR